MRTHVTLIAASLAVALSGAAFGMGNDSGATGRPSPRPIRPSAAPRR